MFLYSTKKTPFISLTIYIQGYRDVRGKQHIKNT